MQTACPSAGSNMVTAISSISSLCGKIAAWLFFSIGLIIIYEVIARYVFTKPTIWVEEMSRFLQIWATYLAAAYALKNRHLITIRVIQDKLPGGFRQVTEFFSLSVIALFSLIAIWHGSHTVLESIRIGRASSTMLSVPLWMTEIAIPIGFGLLFLQVVAEMILLFSGTSGEERMGAEK
jgi:TRAP-type C4-dicarboxylate transport system permease small subunit